MIVTKQDRFVFEKHDTDRGENSDMKKILVAYFSAGGVTRKVAEELAGAEAAELFEICPREPYTAADLDWRDRNSRSTKEMADPDCRPETVGQVKDMNRYDTVFVGFPVWWGREPSVVDTFLDAYDFTGKTIVPFCTSGGSGIGKTAERIRSLVGSGATVTEGKRLGGDVSPADLKLWTEGLGL